MSLFSRRRSFTETVEGRRRFLTRVKVFFLVYLVFECVSVFFVLALSVSSTSMAPSILPGDRLLASSFPYGPSTIFGKLPGFARPERGMLVLVNPPYAGHLSFWPALADSFVRFVTFQRLSLPERGADATIRGPFIMRVIALPGDAIRMEDFVFKVRPADTGHFLTEFELSASRYDIIKPELPASWTPSFPLSGEMDERVLAEDEYFVACDDRGVSSDSRLWGTLRRDLFKSRIFLRYWPLKRFGLP